MIVERKALDLHLVGQVPIANVAFVTLDVVVQVLSNQSNGLRLVFSIDRPIANGTLWREHFVVVRNAKDFVAQIEREWFAFHLFTTYRADKALGMVGSVNGRYDL